MAASRLSLRRHTRGWTSFAVAVSGYAAVIHYCYKLKVAPQFSYQGLTYREPSIIGHATAILLVVIVALALPRRVQRSSDFVLWLFFVVTAAPAMLLPQYMNTLPPGESIRLALVVAACMLLLRIVVGTAPQPGQWGPISVPPGLVWGSLLGFAGATYMLLLATSGLRLSWISFADVYGLREEVARTTVGPAGYALPWLAAVINPVLMARGLYTVKHRRYFVIGALGQCLLYASTGQKSILLTIAGILLIRAFFRRRTWGVSVMRWVAIGAFVSLALDQLLGGILWTSLFVRRFMIVPGALVAGYVSVFQDHPKLWFGRLFGAEPPYELPPENLVGKIFGGDATTNANVGFLGDGYLQGGYLGIFVSAAIVAVVLWVLDQTTRGLPIHVTAAILFMPTIALASSSVTTVIATHGFGIAILVCAVLPRTGWTAVDRQFKPRFTGMSARNIDPGSAAPYAVSSRR